MSHLEGALKWWDSGMSVVTVLADGTKRPMGSWKDFQEFRAQRRRVESWFKTTPEQGVGLICGEVSGGLEMLEIEARRMGSEYWDRIEEALAGQNVKDVWNELLNSGYVETTPSGGIHILYRIGDQRVPGNTKIATDVTGKITYAETRGEGGFVVVAPSGGAVHKTGESWACIAGEVGTVPTIAWGDRVLIHEALRIALDERVLPTYERPTGAVYDRSQGDRPGDAFNDDPSVTIHDILTRNGWKYLGQSRGQDRYVHPYSSDMTTHSAVTGHKGSPNLYAWSGLPAEDYYTKFGLLTHLEFNGDFNAAAKHLYRQGYGTQSQPLDISDWDIPTADETAGVGTVVEPPTPGMAGPTQDQPPKVKVEEWTETGVGEFLARKFGNKFLYVGDQKSWRVYRDGLWRRDERNEVSTAGKYVTGGLLRQAHEFRAQAQEAGDADKLKMADARVRKAEAFRTDRGAKAVISRFGAEPGITTPSSDFDVDVDLLRFTNGTLDLRTMVLREHRPGDKITLDVPYAFDPEAQAPLFTKMVSESLPSEPTRSYLQRFTGYALSGRPTAGVWGVLYGDTGCGKSTYLNVMNAVFGDHARTAAQATFAQRNEGSRAANDLNDIRMARMVMITETKEGQLFNESLIKQYSGGDELNSHGLYQENGTWKNRGVLFMATNHPPRLSADDNANWRRVKMIHFPVSRYSTPDLKPDPELAHKIIDAELPGVMNWVIAGLLEYRQNGLNEPEEITTLVNSHRVDVDPVSQFLSEGAADGYVALGEDLAIPVPQLYQIFTQWCEDNGIPPLGNRRFGLRLTSHHYGQRKGTKGARLRTGIGVGVRGVRGTMLPPPY